MPDDLLPEGVVVESTTELSDREPLLPEEEVRTERMVARRRAEFSTGRACARRALARLGVHGFALLSDADRVPIWPKGVVGSITHCRGFCAVAVARCGPIRALGIDAEPAEPLDPELTRRICTPAEVAHLASLPPLERTSWVRVVFSAKESFYKCYFPLTRHFLGFHDVDVQIDPAAGRFRVALVAPGAPSACGRRGFSGRFRVDPERVVTALALVPGAGDGS